MQSRHPDDPPVLTIEEMAAHHGVTVEQYRAIRHPFEIEAERRNAEIRAYNEAAAARRANVQGRKDEIAAQRAQGPTAVIRGLQPAASHLFTQYTRAAQLSAIIASVAAETGARFTSAAEHSLVDDSILGVRVTRVR
jgi:hypothetical protein